MKIKRQGATRMIRAAGGQRQSGGAVTRCSSSCPSRHVAGLEVLLSGRHKWRSTSSVVAIIAT